MAWGERRPHQKGAALLKMLCTIDLHTEVKHRSSIIQAYFLAPLQSEWSGESEGDDGSCRRVQICWSGLLLCCVGFEDFIAGCRNTRRFLHPGC